MEYLEILNGESSWKNEFDRTHTRYNSQNSQFCIKKNQDITKTFTIRQRLNYY